MATTARQAISSALRRLGVYKANQTVKTSDEALALNVLNLMMAEFPARGLTYTHATLTAASNISLDDKCINGLIAMLALRLTDEFGPELVTRRLRVDANTGMSILRGTLWAVPAVTFDTPNTPDPDTDDDED